MKPASHRTILYLLLSSLSCIAALEAQDYAAVSIKHILDASGQRTGGAWAKDTMVQKAQDTANGILQAAGACWLVVVEDIQDVSGHSPRGSLSLSQQEDETLQTEALSDPSYKFRPDAINIYIVNAMVSSGAPVGRTLDDLIIITAGAGPQVLMHEIAHFLSLTHTYECFQGPNCVPSECMQMGANHQEYYGLAGSFTCGDICPNSNSEDDTNLMGDGQLKTLTPCQVHHMTYELYRGHRFPVCRLGLHVGPQRPLQTIGQGVDAACPWGTVLIDGGTYLSRKLTFDKPVILSAQPVGSSPRVVISRIAIQVVGGN